MNASFQTQGYEDMELSTQLIIAEALKRKMKVEVLDRKENFIALTKGKHTEYIKEATKTSKDSYITSLIMGNKEVTKVLLKKSKLQVPSGKAYSSKKSALADFKNYKNAKTVVKPKSTNFGIGISILNTTFKTIEYKTAVEQAFSHDSSILIEKFIEGIECRFLVIDGKCVAVLHRVPAHIIGDGKHTIKQLVQFKNADPRRGKGHVTPLEKIEMGSIEKQILSKQDFHLNSIPRKDALIYLRENSNISTGGDSLDYTDKVLPQYKRIAEKAAKAVSAKICGVDVILKNPQKAPTLTNHAIIELNFNPVLYFHDFPYEGHNRHVEKYILDLLFS